MDVEGLSSNLSNKAQAYAYIGTKQVACDTIDKALQEESQCTISNINKSMHDSHTKAHIWQSLCTEVKIREEINRCAIHLKKTKHYKAFVIIPDKTN